MRSYSSLASRTAARPALVLLLVLSISPKTAGAATDDASWHFMAQPLLWAAGISGAATFGDHESEVDASFGDILENLDMVLMGRLEARRGRIGFGTDLFWVNLGVGVGDSEVLDPEADIRQTLVEGFLFFRLTSWEGSEQNSGFIDVIGGGRYNSVRARLQGDEIETDQTNMDWVDAYGGLRAYLPLGARFGLYGYGDVGGLGSNLAWSAQADLGYSFSESFGLLAGYRVYDVEYEDDSGVVPKLLDTNLYGPAFSAVMRW